MFHGSSSPLTWRAQCTASDAHPCAKPAPAGAPGSDLPLCEVKLLNGTICKQPDPPAELSSDSQQSQSHVFHDLGACLCGEELDGGSGHHNATVHSSEAPAAAATAHCGDTTSALTTVRCVQPPRALHAACAHTLR